MYLAVRLSLQVSTPRTNRRHTRSEQFISDVSSQLARPPTDLTYRLPPSPRLTNRRQVSFQKINNDNLNNKVRGCTSPATSQPTDHIHNPELYTHPDVDDLTSLPKPQKVIIRSLKELPWVFRYKVKRANSTLAKIMAMNYTNKYTQLKKANKPNEVNILATLFLK
ncbi:hypothetical protein Btru_024740 [Bulinus truncatus]|nr:hypothetical protein Btru_024740 [Bulinus truncatus]